MAQEGRHVSAIEESAVEERAPGIGAGFANQTRVDRVSGLARPCQASSAA